MIVVGDTRFKIDAVSYLMVTYGDHASPGNLPKVTEKKNFSSMMVAWQRVKELLKRFKRLFR